MFERLELSWHVTVESVRLLLRKPELLLFPATSLAANILMIAAFFEATDGRYFMDDVLDGKGPADPRIWAAAITTYVVVVAVTVTCNTALACAVRKVLRGRSTGFTDGLRMALARWRQVLGWTILASTVGLLLRFLRVAARRNASSEWGVGLLDVGWTALTFFAIPVLAAKRCGPFAAVRHSVSVFRRAWGESTAAGIGASAVQTLVCIGTLVPLVVGHFLWQHGRDVLGMTLFVGGVWALMVVIVFGGAVDVVVSTLLYRYVTTGRIADIDDRRFARSLLN